MTSTGRLICRNCHHNGMGGYTYWESKLVYNNQEIYIFYNKKKNQKNGNVGPFSAIADVQYIIGGILLDYLLKFATKKILLDQEMMIRKVLQHNYVYAL